MEEFFDRLEDQEWELTFEEAVGPYPANGNVALALSANEIFQHVHSEQLDALLIEKKSGKSKDAAHGGREQRGKRGDKPMGSAKQTAKNTVFCDHHKGWFPEEDNHSTDNCRCHKRGWKITPHTSSSSPQ